MSETNINENVWFRTEPMLDLELGLSLLFVQMDYNEFSEALVQEQKISTEYFGHGIFNSYVNVDHDNCQ